jgi:hypothetical protein
MPVFDFLNKTNKRFYCERIGRLVKKRQIVVKQNGVYISLIRYVLHKNTVT